MNEMEISRAAAERSLREHMGNVVDALITLTNWELRAGCISVEKVKNMPLEGRLGTAWQILKLLNKSVIF